jgi:hypothetical protein
MCRGPLGYSQGLQGDISFKLSIIFNYFPKEHLIERVANIEFVSGNKNCIKEECVREKSAKKKERKKEKKKINFHFAINHFCLTTHTPPK